MGEKPAMRSVAGGGKPTDGEAREGNNKSMASMTVRFFSSALHSVPSMANRIVGVCSSFELRLGSSTELREITASKVPSAPRWDKASSGLAWP